MALSSFPLRPQTHDPVAAAVEAHFREMAAKKLGQFAVSEKDGKVSAAFGAITVLGETYDIALVRLASALLDDARLKDELLARLRQSSDLTSGNC